jgi:hypothetical protein
MIARLSVWSRPGKIRLACIFGVLLSLAPASVCAAEPVPCEELPAMPTLPADPLEPLFGAKLSRTMALLATSNPARRHTVKILIYGQSISAGMKSSCFERALRVRFPHANLILENRAISGFSANQLVRSAAVDIPLSYPDLVIFHVYGAGSIEYERILADIRRRTTAEIMIWTDHYGNAGVPGDDEYLARVAREDNASNIVRTLAIKYHCEVVDARAAWKAWLAANPGVKPTDLLKDNVHFNDRGKALMTAILLRHFRLNAFGSHDWMNTVRSYEAKRQPDEGSDDEIVFAGAPWKFRESDAVGESSRSALRLTFTGNRVDVIPGATRGLKLGTARILIDGRPPSAHPQLYAFTLPSPAFGADYQPGIRRVTSLAPLLVEDWTLRITAAAERSFEFEVHGSKTGFDGRGRFELGRLANARFGALDFAAPEGDVPEQFVSDSRRVVIEHRDFKILWGQERAKQLSPVGWEIKWSVVPKFIDTFHAAPRTDEALLDPITLAQGLANTTHTLEIIPNDDGSVPIREIVVHRPPLR